MKTKDLPKIDDPLKLLGWIRFLREHGRADAIERKAKTANELLAHLQNEMLEGRQEHYATFMVQMTAADLDGTLELARKVEEYLQHNGWRMNAAGKITRIRKGRGADLLAECVRAIYTTKHQGKGNTAPVRKEIAQEHAPDIEESELSEGTKSNIYRAFYNMEYRRL